MTRLFDPPLEVSVTLDVDGAPRFISGALSGGIQPIERWVVEQDWFSRSVAREYWKATVGGNLLVEVFHDLNLDLWFWERLCD